MPTFTTYDTVGIKEDVDGVISNLTPTKTPFLSMIGKEKTTSRKFEWMEDDLAAVRDNANIEGFEAADSTLTPPDMRSNYTQIFEKTFKISETEDAVDQHGRAKETAYQLVKAGKELKRDTEFAFIGRDQAAVVGNATVTARRSASAVQQVDASVTVAGGAAALSEAMVLSAGQKAYTEGAEPTYLMIKPSDSLLVAGFANTAGRTREIGNERKIVNVVDLYVSPFGEYKVVLNRFQLASTAWLLDPEMWKTVSLRGWTRTPLAKTGDSNRQMLVGEHGLKNTNFRSSALINNIL